MSKIETQYIIVGSGIAATCFAGQLLKAKIPFILFDDQRASATSVAGGTLNPVVLKRFNPVWGASEFLAYAVDFYSEMVALFGVSFLTPIAIARVFHNTEEQNDWMVASDKKNLSHWLDAKVQKQINDHIHSPYGIGKVQGGYQLQPKVLLQNFKKNIEAQHLRKEPFDHTQLESTSEGVEYKNIKAKKIVFAEGARLNENPLTKVSILPKKGEYITVRIPNLDLNMALKAGYFIIPLGNDLYKIGATFAHGDFSETITESGKEQLAKALQKIVKLPFEQVIQEVGMRPTVKDRRPLLGSISGIPNAYIFNGLGTRGLLMAPLLSNWLYDFIAFKKPLPESVDVKRFY